MPAVIAKFLRHGASAVGCNVLQGRRLRRAGIHHDRVRHGPVVLQGLDDPGHGGFLLANGNINADDPRVFLVDDSVHRHCRLAGLAIADDQLALAASDRHHGINGLEPRLERLAHRLTLNDRERPAFNRPRRFRRDDALAVKGQTKRIHHPANQFRTNRHFNDTARALDQVAFLDPLVVAQDDAPNIVALQVHGQAINLVGEFD